MEHSHKVTTECHSIHQIFSHKPPQQHKFNYNSLTGLEQTLGNGEKKIYEEEGERRRKEEEEYVETDRIFVVMNWVEKNKRMKHEKHMREDKTRHEKR